MARQVYYDPFGSRLDGYRQGVADEVGVQGSVRQARNSDWNYNNVLPLALQTAQREEAYNQYADPYRRQNTVYESMGLGDKTALGRYGTLGTIGSALGTQHPTEAFGRTYLSGNFGVPGVEQSVLGALLQGSYDPGVVADSFSHDPRRGQMVLDSLGLLPFDPNRERGIEQYQNFDRALEQAKLGLDYYRAGEDVNYRNATLGVNQQNADSRAVTAQAAAMRAQWATQNPRLSQMGWTPTTDGFYNIYTGQTAPMGSLPEAMPAPIPDTGQPAPMGWPAGPGAVVDPTYAPPAGVPALPPGMEYYYNPTAQPAAPAGSYNRSDDF